MVVAELIVETLKEADRVIVVIKVMVRHPIEVTEEVPTKELVYMYMVELTK